MTEDPKLLFLRAVSLESPIQLLPSCCVPRLSWALICITKSLFALAYSSSLKILIYIINASISLINTS